MCDITNCNILTQMLYYGCYCIAMIIVTAICFVKFSFWLLKLFLLHILKVLIKIVHAIAVEIFEKNNTNNDLLDDDSDNTVYETAEEESLDDFYDSYQLGSWGLLPKDLGFYPMSSLIDLYEVPHKWVLTPITYDSEILHEHESKATCEDTTNYEIPNELDSIPPREDSNISIGFKSTEVQVFECRESTGLYEQSLREAPSEWLDISLICDSNSFFEPDEEKNADCRESKETPEQPHVHETARELVDFHLRYDSSSTIELTEQLVTEWSEPKLTWKQRFLCGISRKRASIPLRDNSTSGIIEHPVTERLESNKTWKQRLFCCMSIKTDI